MYKSTVVGAAAVIAFAPLCSSAVGHAAGAIVGQPFGPGLGGGSAYLRAHQAATLSGAFAKPSSGSGMFAASQGGFGFRDGAMHSGWRGLASGPLAASHNDATIEGLGRRSALASPFGSHDRPPTTSGSGGAIELVTQDAAFPGGRLRIAEKVVTIGGGSEIFGNYSIRFAGISATGRFSDVAGTWRFSVNVLGLHASFTINPQGQMLAGNGAIFTGCIDCGSKGNVGAFDGLGNFSLTSGNNNVGLFDGDFNTGLYSGNNNVGLLNGNFNGSAHNGNANFGLLNGNFNGVGAAFYNNDGTYNGNDNYGVFNGNFNGDSSTFKAVIRQSAKPWPPKPAFARTLRSDF
jgi:hypothetical protein